MSEMQTVAHDAQFVKPAEFRSQADLEMLQ